MRRTLVLLLLTSFAHAAELKPKTRAAFDHYVSVAEARINAELADAAQGKPFLDFELKSAAEQQATKAQLAAGDTVIEKIEDKENGHSIKDAPDGLIHHWRATVFIPGADLKSTLALIQDYDHHKDVYKTQVTASRLLSKTSDGNNETTFKAYLRFYKKKVFAVTLNTEHLAHYKVLSSTRATQSSRTTRVAQVDDAGKPGEHEKPVGNDDGYLWALNSYWRLEQKDSGVYIQCEAISLTRDVPAGLGWLIKPFVTEVPKESLHNTLEDTRAWMMKEK